MKGRAGIWWESVGSQGAWKENRRKPSRDTVHGGVWGGLLYGSSKDRKERTGRRERPGLKVQGGRGRAEMYGRLREEIGMATYFHDPRDYAKVLKLQLRVGDLSLAERKQRYAGGRDDVRCLCDKARESRTHIVR